MISSPSVDRWYCCLQSSEVWMVPLVRQNINIIISPGYLYFFSVLDSHVYFLQFSSSAWCLFFFLRLRLLLTGENPRSTSWSTSQGRVTLQPLGFSCMLSPVGVEVGGVRGRGRGGGLWPQLTANCRAAAVSPPPSPRPPPRPPPPPCVLH